MVQLEFNLLRWCRVRLPSGHGHSGCLDQAAEGAEGRGLEHVLLGPHTDQPTLDGEVHRLRRIPRPGPRGRQDCRVLAHGQGDVHRLYDSLWRLP